MNRRLQMRMPLLALLGFLLLSSCASMSKDECLQADWYIKGLEDASEGYVISRMADHGKACARVKVIPLMTDYEAGHEKGARLYCVPEKGYSSGRAGSAYNDICPQDLENQFLRAYRDGQELFALQQQINRMSNEISSNESRVEVIYSEIQALHFDVSNRINDSRERQYKLRRIDELHFQITDLEVRSDRAAYELELFRHDFRIVESKHYRLGYIQ